MRRIIRALEVWELTGEPLSALQTQWPASPGVSRTGPSRILWLDVPREELYRRINSRVEAMFQAGLVDEARSLPKPLGREASQALGYKEIAVHLEGKADLAQTILLVQTRTRQFAKRQITWFRHLPGCRPATEQLTRTLWQSTI